MTHKLYQTITNRFDFTGQSRFSFEAAFSITYSFVALNCTGCHMSNLNFKKLLNAFPAIAILSVFVGCGSSGPSGTVSGTAKVNGKNSKKGSLITFTAEKGTIATGQVAADGTYKLQIIGEKSPEKIPVGQYKIAVASPSDSEAMTDEQYEAMMNRGGKPPEVKKDGSIPEKYRSGQSSGLTFEVKEGVNTYEISLE